jgi:hypothetical protein
MGRTRKSAVEAGPDRHLAHDEENWVEIAAQVLRGTWTGADDSTIKSLTIGLRSIPHPDCRAALERLGA